MQQLHAAAQCVCYVFFYALACVFNGIPIWPPARRGGNAGFIGGLETVQMALGVLPLQARNVQVSHREKWQIRTYINDDYGDI